MFVANPNKPRGIQEILYRNREKLVEFLEKFHNDRSDDDQFNDEKNYLVKQIKDMKPLDAHWDILYLSSKTLFALLKNW